MALFNYASKELTLKVVYYGPGLSGKTTNLQRLHLNSPTERKGKLVSLSTESDRTLFFDFLPLELGKVKDFMVRFQLYTVPGQIRYNATRQMVLKGADAVVFVADSQTDSMDFNMESLENMRENLLANNIRPEEVQLVFQYNKRDLKNILPVEEMDKQLNPMGYPVFEAEAINGKGVDETFKAVTRLLLKDLANRYNVQLEKAKQEEQYLKQKRTPIVKPGPVPAKPLKSMAPPEKKSVTDRMLEAYSDKSEMLKKSSGKTQPVPPGLQTGTYNDLLEQNQQVYDGPKIELSGPAEKSPEPIKPPGETGSAKIEEIPEPGMAEEVIEPPQTDSTDMTFIISEIDEIKDSFSSFKTEIKTALAEISSTIKTPKKETEINAADIIKLSQTVSRLSEQVEPLKGLDIQKVLPESTVTEILNSFREIKKVQAEMLTLLKGLVRDFEAGKKKSRFLGLI